MSTVIGGLLGNLFGGGRQQQSDRSSRGSANVVTPTDRISKSSADEETAKAKTAAKFALIKTGTGGVLNEAKTGRKKLLGN